jgi:hypothetical protein
MKVANGWAQSRALAASVVPFGHSPYLRGRQIRAAG